MIAAVENGVMLKPGLMNNDKELAEQCRIGNDRAMQVLYTRHSKRLYTLALRLTDNRADAEEVVQDSFVQAWRNIGKFRGDSSIGTWLFRIAVNLSRDKTRKHRSFTKETEVGISPAISDAFARKHLKKALSDLPEGYREVLVMYDVMGMKHPEIADILDIAVGTSKSQLHKARAQMRRLLKKRGMVETV
ncbi:MAG: sigma-70 family RNA polymerase sigma factor [Proteobacteria bacterium]|nr:sigma-70 family RNA polymerase sigma factor [Pseudomonadota bacterium]